MIRLIEELSMNAFPCEKTIFNDGWVTRLSPGSASKRVNSVNPLYETGRSLTELSIEEVNTKIRTCETVFKQLNKKTVFKLTPNSLPKELDKILENKGYTENARTCIMTMPLNGIVFHDDIKLQDINIVIRKDFSSEWLNQFCKLSNKSDTHKDSLHRTLQKIIPQQLYITLLYKDEVIGCGMSVIESGYVGIYNIVIDNKHRNNGYGRFIMDTLLAESIKQGATHTYLQVEAENKYAVQLYRRIGYTVLYEYWYRIQEKISDIDTLIFDLNGTLYERGIPVEGAQNTLSKLRKLGFNLNFVTNTDGRSITDVHNKITAMGFEISIEELLTPISAVKKFIEQNSDKSYHFLVHEDVMEDFKDIEVNRVNPDYIVIGDFCSIANYQTMNSAFRMIKSGTQMIATSKSKWYKDDDGDSLNTGAYVGLFESATGKVARLLGKPSTDFLQMALNRTGSSPSNTIVIGDDVTTDILGGNAIGASTILVKTGLFDEKLLKQTASQPDYILNSINDIFEVLDIG